MDLLSSELDLAHGHVFYLSTQRLGFTSHSMSEADTLALLNETEIHLKACGHFNNVIRYNHLSFIAVILHHTDSEAQNICCDVISALHQTFPLQWFAGIAGGSIDQSLIAKAKQANSYALSKQQPICFHSSELVTNITRSHNILNQIVSNGFSGTHIAYQTIFDTKSVTPKGFEALCRYQHPSLGAVPPLELIEAITPKWLNKFLDLHIFTLVTKDIPLLQRLYGSDTVVSINVSILSVIQKQFIDPVCEFLENYPDTAKAICFELTETEYPPDDKLVIKALNRLRSTGAKIALDDFGTGYSAISQLNKFPIDIVKIDQEFLNNHELGVAIQMIQAISGLAHIHADTVIVEGVETADQLAAISELSGNVLAQGYLLGKPAPIEHLLTTHALNESTPIVKMNRQ